MKFAHILLPLFAVILFTPSCSRTNDQLLRAEALIETAPDSALHILQQLHSDQIKGNSNRALYALLMTKAQDKNDIKVDSDSLISIATDYYNDSEPFLAGYAWLMQAYIARNDNNKHEQVRCLTKANEFNLIASDKKLHGLIKYENALMFFNQRQFKKSIAYYKDATSCFKKINDDRNTTLCYLNIGYSYLFLNNTDSAENYYKKAQKVALRLQNKELLSVIIKSIGTLYFVKKDYVTALQYYLEAPITGLNVYDSNKYYLIADAYIQINNFDSAQFYLQKVKAYSEIGPDYYRLWQHIYEKKGNASKVIFYANKVVNTTDSLYKQKLQISFDGLVRKFKFQNIKLENQKLTLKNKQNELLLMISLLLIIAITATLLFWRLQVKRRQFNTQSILLAQESSHLEKEKENSMLLEKQLELQSILISNIDIHRKNSTKRHSLWKRSSNENYSDQHKAFDKELKAYIDLEYNNFTVRLKNKFPTLTNTEVLICCLMLANFDSGKIAIILDVNNETIITYRHRIRSKLLMTNSENFIDFLRTF